MALSQKQPFCPANRFSVRRKKMTEPEIVQCCLCFSLGKRKIAIELL